MNNYQTIVITKLISSFISNAGWEDANITWFSADWSVRNYARLTKENGETSILLQSPPAGAPEEMIGHEIGKWAAMNRHFKSLGLNVPTILAEDLDNGLILMEDFGNQTIPENDKDAYLKATDILVNMRDNGDALNADLINYEDTHVYRALRFFPQYILKDPDKENAWFAAWDKVETSLPTCPRALTHIDYAPQNLMQLPNGDIGIIDFQAACNGPFVYDLVNLLEDIRRDVPQDIKKACINRFCDKLSPETKDIFAAWYTVITAQFHARILGQIRFLTEEKGRGDLMQYYDPLLKRFEKEIEHPTLKPIKDFIKL